MVYLSRRYSFFASHRLHSNQLSESENCETFGKCNNPFGHGHNYEVEVTVRGEVDAVTGRVVDLRKLDGLAEDNVIGPLRYRNLNAEVAAFKEAVPTTENLAAEIARSLAAAWSSAFPAGPALEKIRIWETERNICEITFEHSISQ